MNQGAEGTLVWDDFVVDFGLEIGADLFDGDGGEIGIAEKVVDKGGELLVAVSGNCIRRDVSITIQNDKRDIERTYSLLTLFLLVGIR